jgi:PAS domain S-box-containing protein
VQNPTQVSNGPPSQPASYGVCAHLAALIESTQDLIWWVDLDYRLVAFNTAHAHNIEKNWGVTARPGMTPFDLLPPAQASVWPPMYARAISDGPHRTEYSLRDGRWLELSFNAVIADGATIGVSVFGKDITERKLAEEFRKGSEKRLRASEARFRSYFNLPLVGMAMTSPEKGFVAVNDRICEILGYSRDELLRMDWAQLTDPEDLQANVDQFERMVAGEIDGYSLNKRFIRKDGQTVFSSISVACVRKQDGTVDYACINVQDISERTRAEQALQASESRFRTLVESAPAAIAITRAGTLLYANQRFAAMFGCRLPDEMIHELVDDRFDLETKSRLRELRRRYLAGEITRATLEGTGLRLDGSQFPFHVEMRVVQLHDGKAVLSFIDDITDRKAAEEAIREAERQYRDIFTEAPEGIFRVTTAGELLAVNPAGAKMLGYESPEEARAAAGNLHSALWIQPDQRVPYARLLEEAGEIHDYKCEFRCKDGSALWVSVSARKVADHNGQPLYYQGFFENLSEKKRLEQELKDHIREIQLLSEMNAALLHASTEEDLLREYCRIVVETGGYRMAWVGVADQGRERRVVPVAHFGFEEGYLETVKITWDDSEYGRGVVGQAIKSGRIVTIEQVQNDQCMHPWRREAGRRGYESSIAIPFRHSSQGMACLTAYGSRINKWSESEQRLMEQIAAALGFGITTVRTAIARDRYQRDLHASLEQTIKLISETVEQRDPYTAGHQRRVADLCARIAEKLGLDAFCIQGLRLAATIHDLGKIAIPAEILAKPGCLTPIQFELIKEHAELGYDIVKNVTFPWPIADIIRQHHERLDGSGYPRGLQGDTILLEARILAVADVVEAMGSHRPYRATRGIEAALAEVLAERGKLYDPRAVDACVTLFQREEYVFPA